MKKYLVLSMVLALAAVPILGCAGYSTPTTPSTTTPPPLANAVTISNFSFAPATLNVPTGTTVTWTNNDSTTHTITSDTGAFSSGNLAPGGTFTHTFTSAGSFGYHCAIHPSMKGTITVE